MYVEGIGVSSGIVIGKVFVLKEVSFKIPTQKSKDILVSKREIDIAINRTIEDILVFKDNALISMGETQSAVFDAHIQIAKDPLLLSEVKQLIESKKMNSAKAYSTVMKTYIKKFSSLDNAYMRERVTDIEDVSKRVLANMLGIELNDVASLSEECIICGQDIAPSDAVRFNKKYVKGLVSVVGSKTAHSAIMARSLKIPSVVGIKNLLQVVKDGDEIIINGNDGYIVVDPKEEEIEYHQNLITEYNRKKASIQKYKCVPCITRDNVSIPLSVNIGAPEDVPGALDIGIDGIGLYRTEFMYMKQLSVPTEDEQYREYREILERMGDKKVVIRTLDIGGDKKMKHIPTDEVLNPSLGYRGLRYSLANIPLFKGQLRALLRASYYGNLHIMFPMVATLGELRRAKSLLKELEQELKIERKKVSPNYKVGIMVEVPSVAVLADQFAKEVDFFSIGTNDLIQYFFAADRSNSKVAYLYQPLNPSFLRLIKQVIDAAHNEGIWTSVCGEVAGDSLVVPLLLGLGLDEFSMNTSSLLEIRQLLCSLSKENMKAISQKALNCTTEHEVKRMLVKYLGH